MKKENSKILSLVIQWKYEDYEYEHGISLEEVGPAFYKMFLNGEDLKHPDELYKYYNDSQNSINSLLEGYFYFPSPRNLNDPFECLINREKQIFNSAKNKEKIAEHRDNIGVCSFSLTNDNPLMWGHYTNNYHGFCLKFDNQVIKLSKDVMLKTHVSYLKKYEPVNSSLREAMRKVSETQINDELKNSIHHHLISSFEYCWKHEDWKHEKEFRYLSVTANTFNRKYFYDKSCLKEIYIDYRMRSRNRNVFNLLMFILKNKYPHVKAFEVKPHPLHVKFDLNPIEVELES